MSKRRWKLCVLLQCAALMVPLATVAQEQAAAADPPIDPAAKAVLDKMANHVSTADRFSVDMISGYDAVQASGQKIEFGASRKLLLQRPAKLRVEVVESNGDRSIVIFDGHELTAFDEASNVYAKEQIPGTIDQAVKHFVGDLKMRLPLAVVLLTTATAELDRRVQELALVEETIVKGKRCDHIAGRTRDVDFQFWVEQGEHPLLHRAIITYKNSEGSPQFWAQLSDWNFAPKVVEEQFRFAPPPGSSRIPFAAQLAARPHAGDAPAGDAP